MAYNIFLFDLDGTLTDSSLGITNSVIYALKKYGITVEDQAQPVSVYRAAAYRFFPGFLWIFRREGAGSGGILPGILPGQRDLREPGI